MKPLKHIFRISLLGTIGSLYISTYGDPRLNLTQNNLRNPANAALPCTLCWYVRICLFPIVLMSGVGIVKKEKRIATPITILSGIGILLSMYIRWTEMHRRTKSEALCWINSIIPCWDPPILRWWRFTLAAAGILTFSYIIRQCRKLK